MPIVTVNSELFNAGLTEDGGTYVGEVFFVEVEFDCGTVWRHRHSFSGVERVMKDNGFYDYISVKEAAIERAEALAQKVRNHVASGGGLDPIHWSDVSLPLRQAFAFPVDQKAEAYEDYEREMFGQRLR